MLNSDTWYCFLYSCISYVAYTWYYILPLHFVCRVCVNLSIPSNLPSYYNWILITEIYVKTIIVWLIRGRGYYSLEKNLYEIRLSPGIDPELTTIWSINGTPIIWKLINFQKGHLKLPCVWSNITTKRILVFWSWWLYF